MKIKICGISNKEDLDGILQLDNSFLPDYMGFIFYSNSPRYMGDTLTPQFISSLPSEIKKVGVFVNESSEKVLQIARDYSLDAVQLHGDEQPDYCEQVKSQGIDVIKVIRIENSLDLDLLKGYKLHVNYFLFDTAGDKYGGNGKLFNWEVLKSYNFSIPR